MIFFRTLLTLLLFTNVAHAQSITGNVFDSKAEALAQVSVALLTEDSVVRQTITNQHGFFRMDIRLVNQKVYRLQLSRIGYQLQEVSFVYPDTAVLHHLTMIADDRLLSEVTVTGKLPQLIRKADRSIINVENSVFSSGLSAVDVLQRSPGVWVDNMGNLRLKGNQPVTVMINDVVQRLGEEELADLLRSLKSDNISYIEIIPNPPSEFEAGGSGGIIHIVLKKGKRKSWAGSVNTEYWQQADKPYFTTGVSLNHQNNKLYLSGGVNYVKDLRNIRERTIITYPGHHSFSNYSNRFEKIQRLQYRFGAVYDFNEKHSVSMQSSFFRTNFQQQFQGDEMYQADQTTYGGASTLKNRLFSLPGVTLNYVYKLDTVGSMLKTTADYSNNRRSETNNFSKINPDPLKQRDWRTNVPVATRVLSLQTDFTKVFSKKFQLKSGLKYATIERDNQLVTEDLIDSVWQPTTGQNSTFLYTENIFMMYASVERTLKHTTIKAGLRAEETSSRGKELIAAETFSRKYFGLFPSVFVLHTLQADKGTSITGSWSRRLTRPALNELNPARIEFANYTTVTGNPNLQPQYSNHFSLAYQFIKNHSIETYFVHTNNFIALSANAGANNSIDYRLENTGVTAEYGVEYSSTISPLPNWTITTNLAMYQSAYTFNEQPYKQTSFYARSLHMISLRRFADIDMMADYRSPYIYTNLYTYGNFYLDIGLTKKVLNNRVKLRLGFTDALNTSREKEWTSEKDYTISFYRKRPTRTIRLALTYQFSSGKKIVSKTIDSGSQEERQRSN